MYKKILSSVLMLLTAATTAMAVVVGIDANGSIPKQMMENNVARKTRIYIQAAKSHQITDAIYNGNYCTLLARTLETNGYEMTKNVTQADYVIFYEFDVSEPYDVTNRVCEQIASAHAFNNDQNSQGDINQYQFVDKVETYYEHTFHLWGYKTSNPDTPIWEMRATTNVQRSNINFILPYMFAAGHYTFYCNSGSNIIRCTTPFLDFDTGIVRKVRAYLNKPY